MILRVGNLKRPNNEAVVTPSYQPIYDFTRRVTSMRVRWDISARVVNYPQASQLLTSAEILALSNAFSNPNPYLALIGDDGSTLTPFVLDPSQCLQGPYLVDLSFPASDAEVYATGLSYRVVFEAVQFVGAGSDLLQFDEELTEDPGGATYVYVGGAVNFAERQLATQQKTYKYTQSGSATGLLTYPSIPPPIWPFAMMQAPRVALSSPQFKGTFDTHYQINWEYNFEWHTKLFGVPHRSPLG
jgi:hypothetical protein